MVILKPPLAPATKSIVIPLAREALFLSRRSVTPPDVTSRSSAAGGPKKRSYLKDESIEPEPIGTSFVGASERRRRALGDRHRGRLHGFGRGAEHRRELARGVLELLDDVAPSDELPVHVELGNGWPARIFLFLISDRRVGQHVDGSLERGDELVQNFDHLGGKPALREPAVALHEEDDPV